MINQKQYGIVATQALVSIAIDDDGNPILDSLAPHPRPDDWTAPDVVPLVKLPAPAHDPATHQCEPVLVWYQDRVHRDWMVGERISSAEDIYNTARSNLAAYWASQPAWIRGPFDSSYQSAVSLLDRHDIDAAIAIITYAPIPSAYDADQLAAFEPVRATLLAGLESLSGE
jgi:hypothetical protein